jgi:hypothetical protein
MDDVTIGRCSQYDNQNLQVDANDSEVLWREATSLLPNLKVRIFWEGHKILWNLHQIFDWQYIGQIYVGDLVAFSEYMNFKKAQIQCETVSLSPHPFIRIEREEIELIDGSNLSIIHHYVRAHHMFSRILSLRIYEKKFTKFYLSNFSWGRMFWMRSNYWKKKLM